MKDVGDRARFGLAFELVSDPDEAATERRRASWGRLQIWVAGINVTTGISVSGGLQDAVACPLLPIVNWFICNWDPLFHEDRLPRAGGGNRTFSSAEWHSHVLDTLPSDEDELDRLVDARLAWWNRHGLGSALPDFRIPDVHFRRREEDIEISWNDSEWRSVPTGIQLAVQPGASTVPVDYVCSVVADWCRQVLDAVKPHVDISAESERLADLASADRLTSRLQLAAGLSNLEGTARQIRQMAGLRDDDITPTVAKLLGLAASAPRQLYAKLTVPVMLYKSAQPELSEQDLSTLFRLVHRLRPGTAPGFAKLRNPIRCPLRPEGATSHGYELAEAFRCALDIPAAAPLMNDHDLEHRVIGSLGIDTADVTLDDRGVEGVSVWMPNRIPLIVINRTGRFASTPWGRRMTLAHELCHLLSDGSKDVGLGVVSNPWAPRLIERRANAFAAMLLTPPESLAPDLSGPPDQWTRQHFACAMSRLGVGATTLCRQLQNLGRISREESEAWLEQLATQVNGQP